MFDHRQKQKLRQWARSPWVTGVVFGVVVLVGLAALQRYLMAERMLERRMVAEANLAALEARQAALQERVEYLSNDRGLEAELRRQFDVTLEGEEVVVIIDDEAEESVYEPLATSTPSAAARPWYQFWRW